VLPLAPLSPEAADCSPPLVLCDPLLSPWLCAVLPEALLDGEPLDWLLGEPEALDGELLELLEELLELLEELLERSRNCSKNCWNYSRNCWTDSRGWAWMPRAKAASEAGAWSGYWRWDIP
jgi:hypothetical protein